MKTILTKGINGHDILILSDGTRYVFKGGKNTLSLNTLRIDKRKQFDELISNTKAQKSGHLLSERVKYWKSREPKFIPHFKES